MNQSQSLQEMALSGIQNPTKSYTHPAGYDRPAGTLIPKMPRHLQLQYVQRRALHLSQVEHSTVLLSTKNDLVQGKWFCVDLNQNTEDGIELIYIETETFYKLADMLRITAHGLRHRAFEVPSKEVNRASQQCFPLEKLNNDTIQTIRSQFKYQGRKTSK